MRLNRLLVTLFLLGCCQFSFGQAVFNSNATTGNWNASGSWALQSGSDADGIPDANDDVTILNGHNITVNVVSAANTVAINVGGTLTAANTLTITTSMTVDGTYTHNRNGGTIPTATWSSGSICNVTGITNTVPGGLGQSFDNFIWNCAGQSGTINFAGALTSIGADFTITTTNGQLLELATSTAPTITISGNLQVDGNSRLAIVTTGSGATLSVGGDFNYNSTNATGSPLKTTGSYTLNVSGNFSMNATGGTLFLSAGNATAGTMNVSRDFTLTAGTIDESGTGSGAINFNGTTTQSFTNNGTIGHNINFTIGASSILDMQGESPLGSSTGTGTLTVSGTMKLGSVSASGALQTARTGGNVMTTGTRTYNSGSKIIYSGLSAQIISSGHPTTSGVTTEIDNASGVSFTTAATGNSAATVMTIPGDLTLTNGDLNIVSTATVRSLTLNGNLTANGNNITISGANTDLVINGTGSFGTFPFPSGSQTIRNFTLNRTSSGSVTFNNALTVSGTTTLTAGTVTFGGATTLTGNVTLSASTVLAFDGQSLSMAGNYTSSGSLSASGASTLSLTGATALTSPLGFLGTNNTLTSLTLNKSNNGVSATVSSALNITSTLTITDGQLAITSSSLNMSNPSTINLNTAGSISSSSPAGGPWNLNYSGSASVNTGFEIPSSGSPQLLSLTSTNTGTITLSQSVIVGTGAITISSGTFVDNAKTVTLSSGNFSISGTYTATGTLTFSGSSSQSITGTNASSTNFNTIVISSGATLSSPTTLNIQGDFTNSGTFSAGSNTVNFSGGNTQTISGSNAQFNNFTVNKSGGTLTINSAETIANNLTLTAGTLTVAAAVSVTGTSSIVTLTAGTFNVNAALSVTGASSQVTLTAGTLAITSNLLSLASGSTLTRAAGAISTSSPSGGPWNLIYTGASKTTSFEIPSSGNVTSVTLNTNNATTITLAAAQNLIASGAFTITNSGRTFNTGTNTVTVGSVSNAGTVTATNSTFNVNGAFTNSGTFTAPTGTLTISGGTFTNSGTFTNNSGTVAIGGAVSISGTAPTFFHFTINASGTFTAPSAMTIQGNLQNDGTFTAGSGTVTLSGNTSKNIQGSSKITFNNLTISGNASCQRFLENTAGTDISGILTLTSVGGNPIFDTDGASGNRVFTMLSTGDKPSVDASIAAVTTSAQLPGKITVQRYLGRYGDAAYNFQVWRDISSPVSTTVADLINSAKTSGLWLPVTGSFTGASSVSGASGWSMFSYDETVTTDTDGNGSNTLDDGWTNFPAATSATSFTKGQGYSMFIFGSDPPVSSNNNAKFDLTGVPNVGNVSLPVTFTSTGTVSNDGWNLVGNPYPSTIDWKSASGWTKTNIDDAIYMDDYSTANPVFASFVNNVGTNGGTKNIGIAQGFWVKANAASPVLSLTEAVKVAGTQTTIFREAAPSNLIRATLVTSDGLRDETVIYFLDSATVGHDSKYDALKMRNQYGYLNLSSISANEKYAINALPLASSDCSTKVVPLGVSDVVTGNYSLSFSQFETMPSSMTIKLRDNFNNTITDIRQNQLYAFSVDENNTSTFGSGRFSMMFTYTGGLPALATQGISACDSSQTKVVITNSSSEFNYSVASANGTVVVPSTQGTNADMSLMIPSGSLVDGTNTFSITQVNRFCTNITSSLSVSLSYLKPPAAPTAASGMSCGEGIVTLNASGASQNGHYNWYDSIASDTAYASQAAVFVTNTLSKSKTFYVSTTNDLGCEGNRTAVLANIIYLDPAAITVTGLSTLQSNYDGGNQWYLNGNIIDGATSKILNITQSGNYKLTVTSQGCSVSVEKDMVVTEINGASDRISVYPNPVKGRLTVEVNSQSEASGELFNSLGVHLSSLYFNSDGNKQSAIHNFSKESAGVYFVKINDGNRITVVRIVKD